MDVTADVKKISLKFLVDREKARLVYAEADNSFVDILFGFMTFPMGTVVRLLEKPSDQKFKGLGSLRALYGSIANLPEKYFCSKESKLMLLNPRNLCEDQCKKLKLQIDDGRPTRYFLCDDWDCSRRSDAFFTTYKDTKCYYCGKLMNREIWAREIWTGETSSRSSSSIGGVFVSDNTTFIITDDLSVMPNTSGSSIRLLNDLGITDTSRLEERTVDISLEEILNLLKWALLFKSALTYLLLKKTPGGDLVLAKHSKSDKPLLSKDTATLSKKMTLKVSLQKSTSKLLFVEADEDFVDLLISFLSIPLGTLIGKLNGSSSLGSIDNLYRSISNMRVGRFMKSEDLKNMLLQPHLVQQPPFYCISYLDNGVYRGYMSRSALMPNCRKAEMCTSLKLQDPMVQSGFIKGPGTFMVTDNLVITPFSSISSINFLNKLNVSLSDVEEHELNIGMEEGLRILKASLKSSSALTNGLKIPLKKPKQEI